MIAESCSRQIRAWADSLQNSDIQGQRHLNEGSRKQWEVNRRRVESQTEFDKTQREIIAKLPPEHPARQQFVRKHGPIDDDLHSPQ